MKKDPYKFKTKIIKAGCGLLCLPIIYLFASSTFPFLKPVLSKAALLSAQLSFIVQNKNTANAFSDSSALKNSNALTGADNTSVIAPPPSDQTSSAPDNKTSSASSETVPENFGTIKRKTYHAGTSSIYIKTGKGYIKNCTSVPAAKIQSVIKQSPKFKIKTNGEPMVLIMHTHTTEAFQESLSNQFDKSFNTRSTDKSKNICRVGDEIETQLKNAGIGVIHDTTYHDYPSFPGCYKRSGATVKKILKKYPSVKVVLDVHRDAIQPDADTMIAPVTTINGKSCAQVMIISGCDDGTMNMPNYMENLKLSAALQRNLEADYPTLTRPVLFDYRKYNQDLTTGSILLEIGGHADILEETIYSGQLVGKSLVKTLLSLK